MHWTIDLRNTPPTDRAVARGNVGNPQGAQRPVNPRAIAFLTLVNDETQYATCLRYIDTLEIPSGHTVERIAVLGATSMTEGYQRAMEASTARYKIYVHQDVYLTHRGLLPELLNLFRTYPRLGMVGVVGTTRMPAYGIWWVRNPFHCHGRVWAYAREGGFPASLLGRHLHLQRFRSLVGDYLPAVAVDGLFLATQYDVPWINSMGGFELYDQVQALEFIKAGLEVGIARQETIWCIHWGPPQERSGQQRMPREIALHRRAGVFRQQNPAFIAVPARTLSQRHRGAAEWLSTAVGNFGDGVTARRTVREDARLPNPARERLGIIIVMFSGQGLLLRALRALLPQFEAIKEIECQIVVVENASTDGTAEALQREFPHVTVLVDANDVWRSSAFNLGLRHLGFPSYVLVMHDDAEFSYETLGRMVSYLKEHPATAGIVACFVDPDGTVQSQRMAIVDPLPRRPRRPQPVAFVDTTCALVRGQVFFDVGLYDERFHFLHQRLDWSIRAKRKGCRFVFLPEARVIRSRDTGSRQNHSTAFAQRPVDDLRLVYKHAGRRWAAALYAGQRILAKWLAFRYRNDSEALHCLSESMARMEGFYRRFRDGNRRPKLF